MAMSKTNRIHGYIYIHPNAENNKVGINQTLVVCYLINVHCLCLLSVSILHSPKKHEHYIITNNILVIE
jgi:hypothetical protein